MAKNEQICWIEYITYVAKCSFKCEGQEVDWSQVQDWEHTGQFAKQAKSEHEGLPDQEEEPEDEAEVKNGLHAWKHEEAGVLWGEGSVGVLVPCQVVAHVDEDDVGGEEDVERHQDQERDDLLWETSRRHKSFRIHYFFNSI